MRSPFIAFFSVLVAMQAFTAQAETPLTYQDHMTRAGEAFQSEDWASFNEQLDAAQAFRPYSLYVWKNRILARQLHGRTDEALALAKLVADRGLSMDMSGHEALDQLATLPAFAPIAERMERNLSADGDTTIVLTSPNATLLPEAYALGGSKDAYIGSVRTGQILRLTPEGESQGIAFAPGGVFDIEVRNNLLLAAVNNQLAYEQADPDRKSASIIVYDVTTGEQVREIRINKPDALIGDIEVAKNGVIYASDSITPRLFKLYLDGQELLEVIDDPRFVNLQGIALNEKRQVIFAADYLTGLYKIDLKSGDVVEIENTINAHLGGIDGLYLFKNTLIGIQNGTTPQRIVKIGLNRKGDKAISFEVLAQNLPEWNEPTHGVVVGKNFQYIATSNWPSYDENWSVADETRLLPLTIMSLPIK